MTRAAEFCYIAEHKDGRILMSLIEDRESGTYQFGWTKIPDMALRMNIKFAALTGSNFGLGWRKILAG